MSNGAQTNESLDVFQVIAVMVDQMAAIAWQKLGLQPDPFSGKLEKDTEQARVAIDIVASLAEQLEPKLDEADRRQVQNLVRDLRVNFVQKSNEP